MPNSLTLKQRQFIAYYLGECHGNASRAALLAGYSDPNANAKRLTGNDRIKAILDSATRSVVSDPAELLATMATIAYQRMGHYGELIACQTMDEAKAQLKELAKRGLDHPIKEITPNRHGAPVVKFYDKLDAQARLGMFLGLWTERITLDLQGHSLEELSIDELQQIARGKSPDRLAQSVN